MLTIFSTPKPFRGHIDLIQRNAIESWKRIRPDAEIILFGDEEGSAEAARDLSIRHVSHVERNEHGTKYLKSIFDQAQQLASQNTLCYVNCDIMLLPSFAAAVTRITAQFPHFLMIGQRWDTEVHEPWDFAHEDWHHRLEELAWRRGSLAGPLGIDYFVFRRGLYRDMPPLVIGRIWWDHWLIWRARLLGTPVIDATASVTAIHQNHTYSYHPEGAAGVWQDQQAMRNFELAGGKWHLYTIQDATHRLTPSAILPNRWHRFAPLQRAARPYFAPAWYRLLDFTRPVRHAVGIRRRMETQKRGAG